MLAVLVVTGCATFHAEDYPPPRLRSGVLMWPRFSCQNAQLSDVLECQQICGNALLPADQAMSFIFRAYVYQLDKELEISLEDLKAINFSTDSYWSKLTSSPRFLCTTDLRQVTVDQVLDSLKNQVGFLWSKTNNCYTIQLREHW
jgi:hypothetical protein